MKSAFADRVLKKGGDRKEFDAVIKFLHKATFPGSFTYTRVSISSTFTTFIFNSSWTRIHSFQDKFLLTRKIKVPVYNKDLRTWWQKCFKHVYSSLPGPGPVSTKELWGIRAVLDAKAALGIEYLCRLLSTPMSYCPGPGKGGSFGMLRGGADIVGKYLFLEIQWPQLI